VPLLLPCLKLPLSGLRYHDLRRTVRVLGWFRGTVKRGGDSAVEVNQRAAVLYLLGARRNMSRERRRSFEGSSGYPWLWLMLRRLLTARPPIPRSPLSLAKQPPGIRMTTVIGPHTLGARFGAADPGLR
jgi:hypothetical protein